MSGTKCMTLLWGGNMKNLFCVAAAIILLLLSCTVAYAENRMGFTKETTFGREGEAITGNAVIGVDAGENVFAIGFKDERIAFYDKNGEFLYQFKFEIMGSYVFCLDSEENLVFMPTRSKNKYIFDSDANLLAEEPYNQEEYDTAFDEGWQSKKIGSSKILSQTYEVRLVTNTGETKVIYSLTMVSRVTRVLAGIGFVLIFVVGIIYTAKHAGTKDTI